MANISVRVPDEVRTYKEKLMFGLTARQLICTVLAVGICAPLYYFGRKTLPEDVISWVVILIALPLLAIGFIRIQGLPMEKYAVAWFKFNWLYPRKRIYRTENVYRDIERRAKKAEIPTKSKKRKALEAQRKQENLERMALLAEAEENGTMIYSLDPKTRQKGDYDPYAEELLTVRKGSSSSGGKKNDDKKKKSVKKEKKSSTQLRAEAVEAKIKDNPEYIPTKKDQKALQSWRTMQDAKRRKEIQKRIQTHKKKNAKMVKRRVAKTTIPKTVQKSIPIIADYEEGIFEVQPNKYSKQYRIRDINYKIQQYEEGVTAFVRLAEFHNYFSEDVHYQLVIDKRVVSKAEQERRIFYQYCGDKYDKHRREFNNKVLRRAIVRGRNDMQKEIYLVVTIDADDPYSALLQFHKIDNDVIMNMRRVGSDAEPFSTDERLAYFHDKFRRGREGELHIDYEWIKENGISSLDEIAPSFMMFDKKEMQIEDYYYRTMYLTNIPASLSDEAFTELGENDFPTTLSLSVMPLAQDKALKLVRKQMTGIEMNKIDAEKRAIKAGYNPETIQHSIKDNYAHITETYDDMLNKNQKLFFVNITVCVGGETLEELDENCKVVMSKARKYTCQLNTFTIQQEEAWKTTLPFGYIAKETAVDRSLTTEALAVFMPFSSQELFQLGGFYYGLNAVSHNLVIVNRTKMKTPSGFVLGSSGSGKSFACKREILAVLLSDDKTGILIIDPENEYGDFCRAFGGEVIKISPSSPNYINPLDMPLEYGLEDDETIETVSIDDAKEKALKKKSDYIVSIIEAMITKSRGYSAESEITAQQRTIIDRALRNTYSEYMKSDFNPAMLPTLEQLQDALDREAGGMNASVDAKNLAEGVEYYTRGSMDMFSHKTNVNLNNRLVVFNIRDLGGQLKQIGLTIIFDFIWNKMIENKNKGVRTYCYCDEIHVMFKSYTSADYLNQLYKRGRKYGLVVTGITQNVRDLLKSDMAQGMLGNSDFIMMLNQNADDLELLTQLLHISDAQKLFVTGAKAGDGLLFAEKLIVPFTDEFPKDSYLYSLMSTAFGENMSSDEVNQIIAELLGEAEQKAMPIGEGEQTTQTADTVDSIFINKSDNKNYEAGGDAELEALKKDAV